MEASSLRPALVLGLLAVVALVAALPVAVAPTGMASAAPTTGTVTGVIDFPAKRTQVEVLWFTSDWQFIGRRNAGAGSYAITNLAPGPVLAAVRGPA